MVLLSLPRIGQFLGIFTDSYSRKRSGLANTSVWLTCPMTFFCQYIGCTWFLKLVNISFQWKQKYYRIFLHHHLLVKCLAYPIIRNIWCSKIHLAGIFVLIDSDAIFLKEENFGKKITDTLFLSTMLVVLHLKNHNFAFSNSFLIPDKIW